MKKWFNIDNIILNEDYEVMNPNTGLTEYEYEFNEKKEYYEKYIYYDKYGIFDMYKDKTNLVTYITKMYLEGTPLGLDFFMRGDYNFSDDFNRIITKKIYKWSFHSLDRVEVALEFLHIHLKRWNIKIRHCLELGHKYYKYYTKENANDIFEDLKKAYLEAWKWKWWPENKEDFLEWWVEIILVDFNFIDYNKED